MLSLRQILVIAIVLATSAVGLCACGQQGDLYMPAEATNPDRASAPIPTLPKPSAFPASAAP